MPILSENEADLALYEIGQKIVVLNLIAPQNLNQEKEKFFNSTRYNPQFAYTIDLDFLTSCEKIINNVQIQAQTWRYSLLEEMKIKFLEEIDLLKNIVGNPEKFQEINFLKYQKPTDILQKELILLTEKDLRKSSVLDLNSQIYTAVQAKQVFEQFLSQKNILWKVKIQPDLVPFLDVDAFQKTIFIHPEISFTELQLNRMIVHEIETHLYRALNGAQLMKLAGTGLKNYEEAAEGLAAYNEYLVDPKETSFLKRFYIRYLAVAQGLQGSFRELYEYLIDQFDLNIEEGWQVAVRVKRGIQDTALPFAFLKDQIYLKGFYRVKNLTDLERLSLYKGKFSLEHLASKDFNLKDDTVIPSAKYLPDLFK